MVCCAFRSLGHRAFSCDVQPCSGGHPEWHIMGDCTLVLDGNCHFTTADGVEHVQDGQWDLIIAHPPCTYMSKAGARWMYRTAGVIDPERLKRALSAKEFFYKCFNAKCEHIAVENPRPLKIIGLPTPTEIIQPYQFGEPYSKATCLWLKGLPVLMSTEIVCEYRPWLPSNTGGAKRGQKHTCGIAKSQKEASRTFKGIAAAMAEQWGAWLVAKLTQKY